MLLNYTALESLNWITPQQACFGVTPDISALLQFHFFQPVYFSDQDAFPDTDERLGHWIGVAENKGDTLTYWTLAENQQVLARSLVRPVSSSEINLRCQEPSEIVDPGVAEVEGSNSNDDTLNLLSDLVNSDPPEFDTTAINGLKDQIGF